MKSKPSEEYDSEGSKKPVILSLEVEKGKYGSFNIVLSNTLIFIFCAKPLFV